MKFPKKAQEVEFKHIILLLVFFAVIIFVAKNLIVAIVVGGNPKACALSVQAAHYSRGGVPVALQCKTDYQFEDYTPEGKDDPEKKKDSMQKLAQLMQTCWDEFGQGQYNAFEGRLSDKSTHCFICSKFSIKQQDSSVGFSETDFSTFLKKEDIPIQKIKYYDFLESGLLTDSDTAVKALKDEKKTLDDPNIKKTIFVKELKLDKRADDGTIEGALGKITAF
ncbi:MAG: hypothetical protein KJ922_06685, partial [Nanoarchaeota archaeon]|nr:hypothetical protein [Nanoarchaeota archaeon]